VSIRATRTPLVVLAGFLVVALVLQPPVVFEPPWLLPLLNLGFVTVIPGYVALIAAAGYRRHGAPVFLALGTGMVAIALGSGILPAILLMSHGPNAAVTVHNVSALLAGMCHLAGVFASPVPVIGGRRRGQHLLLAYGAMTVAIGVLTLGAAAGVTPQFFVPGQGGTSLREMVLGAAIVCFAFAGLSWFKVWQSNRTIEFLAWYAIGLELFALGLVAVLTGGVPGTLATWIGRLAQFTAGVYFLAAVMRAAHGRHVTAAGLDDLGTGIAQALMVYRPMVESLGEALFTLNRSGVILYWNPAAERMFGGRVADAFGQRLASVVAPGATQADVHVRILDLLQGTRFLGGPEAMELLLVDQDDRAFAAELVFHEADVEPSYAICVVRDISGLKAANEALRVTASRYQTIIETAMEGFWVTDTTGRFLEVNDAYCTQSGYAREELLELSIADIEVPVRPEDTVRRIRRIVAEGEDRFETRLRRKDGSVFDVEIGVQFRGADGRLIAFLRDITERRAAEEKLARLNEQLEARVLERTASLEAANKELETFSYSVSHDLKSPLRAITGFAEILERRYGGQLDAKGRHYLDNIVEGGRHMGILIEELLEYSRPDRGPVGSVPVPLGPIVERLRSTYADRIHAAGGMLAVGEPLAVPVADPVRLEQVLANLLDNALTYRRDGVAPQVTVSALRDGDRVRLEVADNGIGIAPEHQEQIFEPFVRLHSSEEYPGTGIGLATVRKAARRMGSEVTVSSVPGEGSTFALELPAATVPETGR
jgi:PAS domain S-box-containing protein